VFDVITDAIASAIIHLPPAPVACGSNSATTALAVPKIE